MTCSEFLQQFSDFYDAAGNISLQRSAEAHLAQCPRCRRYVDIVDRGRELLRSCPPVDVSQDFRHRLQHRLYHVDDGEALRQVGSGSGTTALTALGMAVVLVFAAWAPAVLSWRPEVELTPIVVSRPETPALGLRTPPVSLFPVGNPLPLSDPGVFRGANSLLFQHSLLNDWTRWSLRPGDFE